MRTILVRGSKDCPGGVGSFPTFALDTLTHFWYNQDRRIMAKTSEAERVAMRIGKLINDLTLDLDQVGIYLARDTMITHRRLKEIVEAADFEREQTEFRSEQYDTLF
jgi:hypothetical protein